MKRILTAFSAFCGLFLAGCMPVERFWWTPDGERAVVVIDQTLHLVDGSGDMQRTIRDDGKSAKTLIDDIDWFSDGNRFVAHRVRVFEKWSAARSRIPEAEVQRIEDLAKGIPSLLASAVLVGGDAEQPGKLLDRISGKSSGLLLNAFLLALEKQPEETRRALAQAPNSLAALDGERHEIEGFLVHELALVELPDGGEAEVEVILRSSEAIKSPEISPQETSIAFCRERVDGNLHSIEIVSSEGGKPTRVVDGVHDSFAWTDDGRSIVCMAPVANEGILKQIKKVTFIGESGETLGRKKQKTMNLATAVVPFAPRIGKLPGNGILFASQSGSLPVGSSEMPYEANLYRVSADGGPIGKVPTSPGALPMNLGFFVVSPDGRRVAVVESDTDAVAVVDVKTGRSELVSPAHTGWRCRTMPAWKSDDELTFAALDESSGAVQWKRWHEDEGTNVLSKDWPTDATANWLEKEENER